MDNSPASETAMVLTALPVTGGLGGLNPWAVYVGREPLEPPNVVTVYDTGGPPATVLPSIRAPSIQLRVRSEDYVTGWTKCQELYRTLVSLTSLDRPGVRVVSWVPSTDILAIGRDDADRFLFAVNFNVRLKWT